MINNRDKTDDLFRKGLDGYRVEPSQGLWKIIESRFFPSSGRRRTVALTSVLIFLLAGSALVTWWTMPRNGNGHEQVATTLSTPVGNTDQPSQLQNQEPRQMEPAPSVRDEPGKPLPANSTPPEKTFSPLQDPDELATEQDHLGELTAMPDSHRGLSAWSYTRSALSDGFYLESLTAEIPGFPSSGPASLVPTPFSATLPVFSTLKNAYVRTYELHVGASFIPSVLFYDPNPNNTGWSAGLKLTYSRSRFQIYAGAGVSEFKDKGSWQINYQSYDSVGYYNNISSFQVDPDNPERVIFETSQETLYDSVPHVAIQEKTNTYTYIDIPVGIGMTLFKTRRLSLGIRTGIKFSMLAGKNEPTADISLPGASGIEIIREVPARLNTTWRFTAGLEASYLLTGRLSMQIEPVYEQYLRSVYVNAPGYRAKKPYLVGVKIGVRYRIR